MCFSRIFHEMQFSCILKYENTKNTSDQDNCNIILPVCYKHPIFQIIRFTDMKGCLYAGHINLNRKDEKVCGIEVP